MIFTKILQYIWWYYHKSIAKEDKISVLNLPEYTYPYIHKNPPILLIWTYGRLFSHGPQSFKPWSNDWMRGSHDHPGNGNSKTMPSPISSGFTNGGVPPVLIHTHRIFHHKPEKIAHLPTQNGVFHRIFHEINHFNRMFHHLSSMFIGFSMKSTIPFEVPILGSIHICIIYPSY